MKINTIYDFYLQSISCYLQYSLSVTDDQRHRKISVAPTTVKKTGRRGITSVNEIIKRNLLVKCRNKLID